MIARTLRAERSLVYRRSRRRHPARLADNRGTVEVEVTVKARMKNCQCLDRVWQAAAGAYRLYRSVRSSSGICA